jgi:uncharacterized protein (DUF1499 family)
MRVSKLLWLWFPVGCLSLQQQPPTRDGSRRTFLGTIAGAAAVTVTAVASTLALEPSVARAETVGKDPDCNDRSCLGVWDGLLADCPHGRNAGAGCTSSQDDTPGIFAEPWDYAEAPNNSLDWHVQMKLLVPTIELVCARRGDQAQILKQQERYLLVVFTDGKSSDRSIGEFYFTPNDSTVQFRVGSLSSANKNGGALPFPTSSSLRNIERCEMIRKELRFLKLPVLRNRKQSLFFGESDLDSFGPGSASLGPPAEMRPGEMEGRFSQDIDPKLKIDLLQQFPYAQK